ncbi:MAG: hypothetical protein EXR79_01335 [Myxococcales bacterium]|nr:hypothetical protein [Myxococcales bacterium]
MPLHQLCQRLEACERDTAAHLGWSAAQRLAHWRTYAGDSERLAQFVRQKLYRTAINGWALHQRGGVTLESIVIEFGVPIFSADDIAQARRTLRLAHGATARP